MSRYPPPRSRASHLGRYPVLLQARALEGTLAALWTRGGRSGHSVIALLTDTRAVPRTTILITPHLVLATWTPEDVSDLPAAHSDPNGSAWQRYSLDILRKGVGMRIVWLWKSTVTPPASTRTTRPSPYASWVTRSSSTYCSTTGAEEGWKGLPARRWRRFRDVDAIDTSMRAKSVRGAHPRTGEKAPAQVGSGITPAGLGVVLGPDADVSAGIGYGGGHSSLILRRGLSTRRSP